MSIIHNGALHYHDDIYGDITFDDMENEGIRDHLMT